MGVQFSIAYFGSDMSWITPVEKLLLFTNVTHLSNIIYMSNFIYLTDIIPFCNNNNTF